MAEVAFFPRSRIRRVILNGKVIHDQHAAEWLLDEQETRVYLAEHATRYPPGLRGPGGIDDLDWQRV